MPIKCYRCNQPLYHEPAVLYSPLRAEKFPLCDICYRLLSIALRADQIELERSKPKHEETP